MLSLQIRDVDNNETVFQCFIQRDSADIAFVDCRYDAETMFGRDNFFRERVGDGAPIVQYTINERKCLRLAILISSM